jgi:hypothetical protein
MGNSLNNQTLQKEIPVNANKQEKEIPVNANKQEKEIPVNANKQEKENSTISTTPIKKWGFFGGYNRKRSKNNMSRKSDKKKMSMKRCGKSIKKTSK